MILTAEQRAAAMAGEDVDVPVSRGSIRRGLWTNGVFVYQIDSSFRKFPGRRTNPLTGFVLLFTVHSSNASKLKHFYFNKETFNSW